MMDRIAYNVTDCCLGRLLVACTQVGVCAVAFADDDEALHTELHSRFEAKRVHKAPQAIAGYLRWVLDELAGKQRVEELPLHVRSTGFQQAVWSALQAIPRGETRTYTQLAAALGRLPTSARAVAQACAANPVALANPCHRAVGSAGDLCGFRWGVERKRRLLELERL